jgi:hypothetical protein
MQPRESPRPSQQENHEANCKKQSHQLGTGTGGSWQHGCFWQTVAFMWVTSLRDQRKRERDREKERERERERALWCVPSCGLHSCALL